MDLFNPVPTSGQIRQLRKRVRSAVSAAATRGQHAVADGGVGGGWSAARRGVQWSPVEPGLSHLAHTLAAAGLAGLDYLEGASDDAHDAVEEALARIYTWTHPRRRVAGHAVAGTGGTPALVDGAAGRRSSRVRRGPDEPPATLRRFAH